MSRTTTSIRLAAAAAVAVAAFVAGTGTAAAETVSIPVPKVVVVGALNTVLAGMQVHLDGYGSKHKDGRYLSWLERDASTVSIAGVGTTRFSAHEEIDKKTTKTRRLRAYVSSIDTTAIAASIDGSAIRLAAMFESGGDEVKIKCLRYRVLKKDWKDECVIPSLAGKSLQIDDALLQARLRPVAHDGSISFEPDDVDFDATIKAGGLCGALDGLCTRITDYKDKLRNQVEEITFDLLDDGDLRDLVAARVRDALEAAGILQPDWKVVAVQDAGSSWSITVERPDQIDGHSVKILGFAPLTANVPHTCPVNVGFEATVWTQYALSGRVWLQHDNGTTSPKLDWSAGKNAVSESTIARLFNGSDGVSYPNRWSRLVVEWRDQKGTVYTATSGKAIFKVTCLEDTIDITG
jgi:hypothetical protein